MELSKRTRESYLRDMTGRCEGYRYLCRSKAYTKCPGTEAAAWLRNWLYGRRRRDASDGKAEMTVMKLA